MLSSVLKSETAIQASIGIMRAFSQVRQYLMAASTVSAEVKELRAKVDLLAIGELSSRIEEKKHEPQRKIGFKRSDEA